MLVSLVRCMLLCNAPLQAAARRRHISHSRTCRVPQMVPQQLSATGQWQCDRPSRRVGSHAAANTSEQATAGATSNKDKEAARASKGSGEVEKEAAKSDEYTEEMQAKMGTVLTYRHEDGGWPVVLSGHSLVQLLQTLDA